MLFLIKPLGAVSVNNNLQTEISPNLVKNTNQEMGGKNSEGLVIKSSQTF